MRFEWFVAQRYLRSPYRPAVLRLVTLFSMIGVAAGVATLVIALSMNTGFRETLEDRLLGVTAHVSLTRPGSGGIKNYQELATQLARGAGVRSVTPAVYQPVLLSFAGQARGVVTKGIDPERERKSDQALQRMAAGSLDFSADAYGIEALLIGKQLAEEWKVSPGDYVTLTSPQGRLTPYGLVPRTRRFRVAGVFDSGFYDYDENWCFMTLAAAQGLSGAGDAVNVLEFRLHQPELAGEIAKQVRQAAGPGFSTTTWMEENRALFRALRLEKLVTAIFIGLITFVAGLNILVVLSMTVIDKARDIAVLRSMGARREQIRGYGYDEFSVFAELVQNAEDAYAQELMKPTAPFQQRLYDEMLARGSRTGTALLTRKDGTTVEFDYHASTTRVARLELFVSVGFVRD